MRFSSLPFLFGFLPITLAIYFAVPLRWRNLALLLTSLVFYGWGEPIYISIMVLSILIDYTHGLLVEFNWCVRYASSCGDYMEKRSSGF